MATRTSQTHRRSRRPAVAAVCCVLLAAGIYVDRVGYEPLIGAARIMWLVGAAGLVLVGVATALLGRYGSQSREVARGSSRSRRSEGMASRWALFRFSSRWAMLLKAPSMRPSWKTAAYEYPAPNAIFRESRLGQLAHRKALDLGSWAARRPVGRVALRVGRWAHDLPAVRYVHAINYALGQPVTAYAVKVCKVNGKWIYTTPRDIVTRVGGPGSGKSVALVETIVDAPGAVIATSTRTDLLFTAGPLRMKRTGTPAMIFNPSGVGGLSNTVKFSPLHGCTDPAVAYQRAEDMVGKRAGSGDAERWDQQAQRILAALMHAAALADEDFLTIADWVADPLAHKEAVLTALYRSPERRAFLADVTQFLTTNDRTQTSITSTVRMALQWINNGTARASAAPGGEPFDVAEFLATNGTIFVLGAQESHVEPLVGAFTGYVAREARRLARLNRPDRLDPWLTLALDEAALVKVPLPEWTADMGGSGIRIEIAVQGRSQLEATWGREGAGTILNNSGTLLVFGAVRDPADLEAWSKLTGHRVDEDGRLVPVLSPAEVSQLRQWRCLVVSRATERISLGRVPKAWRRADIRRAQRKYGAPEPMETEYGGVEDPEGVGDD